MASKPAKPLPKEEDRPAGFATEVARYLDGMTPKERARLEEAERLDREHGSDPENEPDPKP